MDGRHVLYAVAKGFTLARNSMYYNRYILHRRKEPVVIEQEFNDVSFSEALVAAVFTQKEAKCLTAAKRH